MRALYLFSKWCCSSLLVALLALSVLQAQTSQGVPINEHQAKLLKEVEELKQEVQTHPDHAKAHYKLGVAYAGLRQWQNAAAAYEQAAQLDANDPETYYNLAWVYTQLGKHEESIKAHHQVLRIDPKYAESHFGIAWSHYCLQRYNEVLEAYKQALQLKPRFAGAHYELGRVYVAMGNKDAALEKARALGKLDRELADLLQREISRTLEPGAENTAPPSSGESNQLMTDRTNKASRPKILYRERATYTQAARTYKACGVVVLSVIFTSDSRLSRLRTPLRVDGKSHRGRREDPLLPCDQRWRAGQRQNEYRI